MANNTENIGLQILFRFPLMPLKRSGNFLRPTVLTPLSYQGYVVLQHSEGSIFLFQDIIHVKQKEQGQSPHCFQYIKYQM